MRAVVSGVVMYGCVPSARSVDSLSMAGMSAARTRGTGRIAAACSGSGLTKGAASIASRYARIVSTGRR